MFTPPAPPTRAQAEADANTPYVFQPFPKWLYRAATKETGGIQVEGRIVETEGEYHDALSHAWMDTPKEAREAEERRQELIGTAAAERYAADLKLSEAAQVEAASVDASTGKHVPEIPVAPKRGRKVQS